jgi:hypothetical protein
MQFYFEWVSSSDSTANWPGRRRSRQWLSPGHQLAVGVAGLESTKCQGDMCDGQFYLTHIGGLHSRPCVPIGRLVVWGGLLQTRNATIQCLGGSRSKVSVWRTAGGEVTGHFVHGLLVPGQFVPGTSRPNCPRTGWDWACKPPGCCLVQT